MIGLGLTALIVGVSIAPVGHQVSQAAAQAHPHGPDLARFTGWTLIVPPLAVLWARRHDVARHRRTMMGLFYGGFFFNAFIAFIPGRTMWPPFLG